MSGANLAVIRVLLRRDLYLSGRRLLTVLIAAALAASCWVLLAFGLQPEAVAGDTAARFFFPGLLLLNTAICSIAAHADVVEGRRAGLLELALLGPAHRVAVVAGVSLGAAALTLLGAVILLPLASTAGWPLEQIHWPLLLGALLLVSLSASAITAALAWASKQSSTYWAAAAGCFLLLWLGSGAIAPLSVSPMGDWLFRLNPLAHGILLLRWALGGEAAGASEAWFAVAGSLTVVILGSAVAAVFGARRE